MSGNGALTVRQVVRLRHFGVKTLEDLLNAVEGFLKEHIRLGSPSQGRSDEVQEETHHCPQKALTSGLRSSQVESPWAGVGKVLSPLLAAASELHNVTTLAHVLGPDVTELANRIGICSELESIRIEHVTGGAEGPVSVALRRVTEVVDSASEAERKVIENRFLRTPPATLATVGAQVGVTRERVRQVQGKFKRKIDTALGNETQIVASVLKERLGHLAEETAVGLQIDEILPTKEGLARSLFRKSVIDAMGFELKNGMYCDTHAIDILSEVKKQILRLKDDVGLVDEQQLIASLPDDYWRQVWPWVRDHCRLYDVAGSLGIRDTGKARVKSALISIGRAATAAEIAIRCRISTRKTRAHLSVIPSVVKADKDRFALKEWVDDPYDGIVGEIVQRINEDGGATTVERLLSELPDKFGVKPMSVQAYMNTAKFEIVDGWISLASKSSVRLRSLDDVIHGRDANGAPYWSFAVETRHFNGYSVPNVPPEIAKALGCPPDCGKRVRIENLPACRYLSIRWNLASTTGASLGYLSDALKRLELEPGDHVRVAVVGDCRVELSVDRRTIPRVEKTDADANLKRIMERRRIL